MSSKREQIVQAIMTRLADTVGVAGRVYRSQADPNDRTKHPFVAVRWINEQASPDTVPQLERTLTVEVACYTRAENLTDAPDQLADDILVSAHALLMADTQLVTNGVPLAIDIRLEDADTEIVAADMPAAKTAHRYAVKFRHSYTDLTT